MFGKKNLGQKIIGFNFGFNIWFNIGIKIGAQYWDQYWGSILGKILGEASYLKNRKIWDKVPNRLDPPPYRIFQTFLNFRLI